MDWTVSFFFCSVSSVNNANEDFSLLILFGNLPVVFTSDLPFWRFQPIVKLFVFLNYLIICDDYGFKLFNFSNFH